MRERAKRQPGAGWAFTTSSEGADKAIKDPQQAAIKNENMFAVLMEATKYCSLGQLTAAMFEVGGAVQKEYVDPKLVEGLGVPARRLAVGLSLQVLMRITALRALQSGMTGQTSGKLIPANSPQ